MEKMLYEASLNGSVPTLNALIQQDPLILDRTSVTCFNETPLHVAALRGHLDFARALLSLKRKLATELDSLRRTPLHLASAEGYTEIVRELLRVSPDVCVARDQDGRTPLHLAAMKGRVEVIQALIQARPESTEIKLNRGETVLHLCVKYNHFEALKLLVESERDDELANSKDEDGNTILHLAVVHKQMETIKYLLSRSGIKAKANALNKDGFTALDALEHRSRDMEIRDFLLESGVGRAKDLKTSPPVKPSENVVPPSRARISCFGRCMKGLKSHDNWLEETHGTLMLVATVIASMTFQSSLNPPGGVWQEDTHKGSDCEDTCEAGTAVLGYAYSATYRKFVIFNTSSFISSLGIILLLMSGLPLKNKFCMWLLNIGMWTTVTFLALTYITSTNLVAPDPVWDSVDTMCNLSIYIWVGLLSILGVIVTVRFIYWLGKKIHKFIRHIMQAIRGNSGQPGRSMGQKIHNFIRHKMQPSPENRGQPLRAA